MIIETSLYGIYVHSQDRNVIYNRILSTGGDCFYPDMLIESGLPEDSLISDEAYEAAVSMSKKYGTAFCIFMSVCDSRYLNGIKTSLQKMSSLAELSRNPSLDALWEKISADLSLSATMKSSLKWLLTYYSLIGDPDALISEIRSHNELPVNNKKEGKRIYEQIRQRILCT